MKVWPVDLEIERSAAFASVSTARSSAARALHGAQPDSMLEASAWSTAACRDCLRLMLAAGQVRPAQGRWSARLKALRQLIESHARAGVGLAAKVQGGDRAAGWHLLAVLADLQYWLSVLAVPA